VSKKKIRTENSPNVLQLGTDLLWHIHPEQHHSKKEWIIAAHKTQMHLRTLMLRDTTQTQSLQTRGFQLDGILTKANLQEQKASQRLPETGN
jgi:hypothetical protein